MKKNCKKKLDFVIEEKDTCAKEYFYISELFKDIKNFSSEPNFNFQNYLISNYYLKKKKKSSFSDANILLLKTRNKVYKILKEVINKKYDDIEKEKLKEEDKLESDKKLKLEKCGSFIFKIEIEKLPVINKKNRIKLALKTITKSKISDILKMLKYKQKENINKLENLFSKIKKNINKKQNEEEIFFEKKKDSIIASNLIKKEEWLYNSKTFLTPEKKYIKILQRKKKIQSQKKIFDFQNFKPIKKKKKKRYWKYICQVCNSADYNDKNKILLCDFCNVSVHQDCIGLTEIPKDEFICECCRAFGENGKMLKCYLCSNRGGVFYKSEMNYSESVFCHNFGYRDWIKAEKLKRGCFSKDTFFDTYKKNNVKFKNTLSKDIEIELGLFKKDLSEERKSILYDYHIQSFVFSKEELENQPVPEKLWFHFSCGFWNNQISSKNQKFYDLDVLDNENFFQKCSICNKKEGFCVKCNDKNCDNKFHVECARRCDFYLTEKREFPHNIIYCSDHIPLKIKKVIKEREEMEKEQISKFFHRLKKIFKENDIEIPVDIFKKQNRKLLNKKQEILKLRFGPKEKKRDRVRRIVKKICQEYPEWRCVIKLKKLEKKNNYKILKIEMPSKIYLKDFIEKKNEIWNKASKKLEMEKKSIWKYFSFEKRKTGLGCIYCKKFGRGLYKCESCWIYRLHSQCLKITSTKKGEVNKHFLFCPACIKHYKDNICKKEVDMHIEVKREGDTTIFLKKVFKDRRRKKIKGKEKIKEIEEEKKEGIKENEVKESIKEMEIEEEKLEGKEEKKIQIEENEVKEVKEGIKEVKEDIKEVKEDIKEVKEDIKEVKEEIKEAKEDIKEAKEEIESIKEIEIEGNEGNKENGLKKENEGNEVKEVDEGNEDNGGNGNGVLKVN